jgi:hypothetical protein
MPRAAWIGVAVVVVLIGLMGAISYLAGNGTVTPQLGDREAGPYNAVRLANEIADRGPFLLADASPNRSLDVFVQHLGEDPSTGWSAFLARAPGQDNRSCTLTWDKTRFVDPCGGATFPADGAGLRRFATRVTGGQVYVSFSAATSAK